MTDLLLQIAPGTIELYHGRRAYRSGRTDLLPRVEWGDSTPRALTDALRSALAADAVGAARRVAIQVDDALVHPFHTGPVPDLVTPREIDAWLADQMERATGQPVGQTRIRAGCPSPTGILGYAMRAGLVDAVTAVCTAAGLQVTELIAGSARHLPRRFGWRSSGVLVSSRWSDTLIASDGTGSVAVRRLRPAATVQDRPAPEWAELELDRRSIMLPRASLERLDV